MNWNLVIPFQMGQISPELYTQKTHFIKNCNLHFARNLSRHINVSD